MDGNINPNGIWAARGGSGSRRVVLLHGLGATASVWNGIIPILERRGFSWLAPDLRGHGLSASDGPFGYGNCAADVAELLNGDDPATTVILGHSFGGLIGALLCTGLFGPTPSQLIGVGIKLDWSEQDIAGARAAAERPAKSFATREEAVERYLRVSGLTDLVSAFSPEAERGVVADGEGYALAMNPRVFSAVGPSIDAIMRSVAVPFKLAAGSEDPMVGESAMRRYDPLANVLVGLGHNAHVQDPERVAALVD